MRSYSRNSIAIVAVSSILALVAFASLAAQQTIGIGSIANDGTGDPLRTAFTKSNSNFTELYGIGHPGYVSGNWYYGQQHPIFGTGAVEGANSIRLYPIYIGKTMVVSAIGARITTGAASSNIALAVYNNAAGKPGTLVDNTASISSVGTGAVNAAPSLGNMTLAPGWYWLASVTDTGTVVCIGLTSSANNPWGPEFIGSPTQTDVNSTGSVVIGYSFAGTFGTWPNLTGQAVSVVNSTGAVWVVGLKSN